MTKFENDLTVVVFTIGFYLLILLIIEIQIKWKEL